MSSVDNEKERFLTYLEQTLTILNIHSYTKVLRIRITSSEYIESSIIDIDIFIDDPVLESYINIFYDKKFYNSHLKGRKEAKAAIRQYIEGVIKKVKEEQGWDFPIRAWTYYKPEMVEIY